MSFANNNISDSEKNKIKNFINEGLRVFQEVEDLKGGLTDLGKTLAEELGVKPAQLMKALRTEYKKTLEDEQENMDTILEILVAAGRA